MIENEDEEGQEPGAVLVLNSWDHSYCLSEKELVHEKQTEDGVSKETSNVIQCPKTAINDRITAIGTYFGAYSEIRYVNSRIDAKPSMARRKMKACLLQNGSILQQPVRINKTYFVEATCVFDSVAQILLSAAVDHPEYDSAIKNSTNAMLQFVVHTLTCGVTRKTYTDRASLLLNWYEPTPKVQTENRTLSFTLSAYDTVYNFVNLAMTTESSLDVIEECSQSCKRKYSLVTVSPNHTTIQKPSYGALEHALNFSPRLTKLPCFNRDCRGLMTRTNRLGIHLLIDADVRVGIGASQSIRCSLANISTSLKLRDDKDNHIQYRLSGTVTYAVNHFTGYSIRNARKWERSDDMEQNKIPALAQTEIVPHLITYVRTSEI